MTESQWKIGRPRKTTRISGEVQHAQANTAATSVVIQGSLTNVGINVHTSTVQLNLNHAGIHGRIPGKKPLLKKRNKMFGITKQKLINKQANIFMVEYVQTRDFEKNDRRYIWWASNRAFKENNFVQSVTDGRDNIMICWCFAAAGYILRIYSKMNSARYQAILNENDLPCVWMVSKRKIQILECPSQTQLKICRFS